MAALGWGTAAAGSRRWEALMRCLLRGLCPVTPHSLGPGGTVLPWAPLACGSGGRGKGRLWQDPGSLGAGVVAVEQENCCEPRVTLNHLALRKQNVM